MQRLILVYNPYSSNFRKVEQEVLVPARKLQGFELGKFVLKKAPVEENARRLKSVLRDGDLVVVAGGDGTVHMVINAVMQAQAKDVCLAFLSYGNFNDNASATVSKDLVAVLAAFEAKRFCKAYPLRCEVDGELWHYALAYFSLGMMAEACTIFEKKQLRRHLKQDLRRRMWSFAALFKWWRQHRKREFLGQMLKVNKKSWQSASDIFILNGSRMGGIMKNRNNLCDKKQFDLKVARLGNLASITSFMLKAMRGRLGVEKVEEVAIDFNEKRTIWIQGEGEAKKIEAERVVFRKGDKSVRILAK